MLRSTAKFIFSYILDSSLVLNSVMVSSKFLHPSNLSVSKGRLCGHVGEWFLMCTNDVVPTFYVGAKLFKILYDLRKFHFMWDIMVLRIIEDFKIYNTYYKPCAFSCISAPPDANTLASVSKIKSRSKLDSYGTGVLVNFAFN